MKPASFEGVFLYPVKYISIGNEKYYIGMFYFCRQTKVRKMFVCKSFQKTFVLALLGMVAIIFAPLLLSALAVLLIFAFFGFLFWTLVRGLKPVPTEDWRKAGKYCVRAKGCFNHFTNEVVRITNDLTKTSQRVSNRVGILLLEMISGAILGCLLVILRGTANNETDSPLWLIGAAIGAALGVLVVCSRRDSGQMITQKESSSRLKCPSC